MAKTAKVILDLVTTKFARGLKSTRKNWNAWGKSILNVRNMLGAIFLGAIANRIGQFGRVAYDAFAKQEIAVNNLAAGLALAGEKSKGALARVQDFASGIQRITTIGDEVVLDLAAMGASMGKMTGPGLERATVAAIGLSKAYRVDLVAAMRLVSRARMGDFATLTRYGIKLQEGADDQAKFNQLLKIGAENFSLATAETQTASGQMKQWANVWGDIKENIGKGEAGAFREFGVEVMKSIGGIEQWNAAWGEFVGLKVKEYLLELAADIVYVIGQLERAWALMRHGPLTAGGVWDAITGRNPIDEMMAGYAGGTRRIELAESLWRRSQTAAGEADEAERRAKLKEAMRAHTDATIDVIKTETHRIKAQAAMRGD